MFVKEYLLVSKYNFIPLWQRMYLTDVRNFAKKELHKEAKIQ